MKLKLWNEENTKNAAEDQLFLKLISEQKNEDLLLICCDKEGKEIEGGSLLVIDQDLRAIVKLRHINEKIPLKTDINNSLLIASEEEARNTLELEGHTLFHSLTRMRNLAELVLNKNKQECTDDKK